MDGENAIGPLIAWGEIATQAASTTGTGVVAKAGSKFARFAENL
ncbi:hypothetical protein RMSM_06726 [Rhodopirellula maiorica SM1]|uniref:Uncharacterized protein n=1 Tax=Rhodopirellula maiorica SM1 TaxID=1265738 RepID=M5RLS9_9BACT|nr:hypothetical protein RMSM_06726 [Rhodopirellula maiorica SM1]